MKVKNTYTAARLRINDAGNFVKGISSMADLSGHDRIDKSKIPRCYQEIEEAVKSGYTSIGFNFPNNRTDACCSGRTVGQLLPMFMEVIQTHGSTHKTYAFLDHSCDNSLHCSCRKESTDKNLLDYANRLLEDYMVENKSGKFPSFIMGTEFAYSGKRSLEENANIAFRRLEFNPEDGKLMQLKTSIGRYYYHTGIVHRADPNMSDLEVYAGLLN